MERIEETPLESTMQADQPSSPGEASTSEEVCSRSLSPVGTSMKSLSLMEDSFDYPDDEATRNKIIAAAIQQEDEFLEYLMSLPAAGALVEKKDEEKKVEKDGQKKQPKEKKSGSKKAPPLFRSTSEKVGATVGLDHLDNLCRLMEQLGDLKEKNSKLQRRVQYLEDLKKLQEMHSQLQQETKTSRQREAELLQTIQRQREPTFIANSPRRSKKLNRPRQSLQPSSQKRERSQSVGIDEINDYQNDHSNLSNKQTKRRQRRSIAEFSSGNKGKVSKWTKVKEAFRWEKASVVMLPETKSQDSGLGGISGHHCLEDGGRYLRVPVGEMLSGSPSADSVISGHSVCSSGGPSTGEYAYCSSGEPSTGEYAYMPLTTTMISSSSSSEELDFDYNYSDIMLELGPLRSASATESMGVQPAVKESRRLSLRKMSEEEEASRRSRSLDGDDATGSILIARHFANKDGIKTCAQQNKSHKTPWGKVKDIIQTRKDSLKQRTPSHGDSMKQRHGDTIKQRHADSAKQRQYDSVKRRLQRKMDTRDAQTSSDHDEGAPVFDPGDTPLGDGVKRASPSREDSVETVKARPRIEVTSDLSRRHKTSTTSLGATLDPTLTSRRLTPMLTITLPSTEELSLLNKKVTKCNAKPPPSPQSEDRLQKLSASAAQSAEEVAVSKNEYRQQTSVSAGTSPPVHRRSSKWTKVKKAFLTSTHAHRDDDASGHFSSCSVPSSPNRTSSFFYETDPEELSGGELVEGMGDDDSPHRTSTSDPISVHAEIQRNYEALQQKLSQEFHKKLHEWEKMKASGSSATPSCSRTSTSAGGGGDENFHHDKGFRRKMEEWERMKHKDSSNNSKRESVALHQLDEDNLSPHFKKKLQEWKRIKKIGPRDDSQQSRKRLVEWQLWRTGSGKQVSDDQEDFQRKLQEWERIKSVSPCESPTSKEAGTDSDRNSSGAKTPSPGVVRKDSTGNAKKKVFGGNGVGKPIPKVKTQKEKELQWLEKELQKIEREKQRLEREREKYLEREARLEKMRRAVGSNHPGKQEVLVQTSTGFFRFQGISEKFTRRLYEWEKARGIAPEASTFALLDPGYRPPGERHGGGADCGDNGVLTRSKSASSVTNLTGGNGLGASIAHQQSSLSLNDVDALEQSALEDGRASSDPQLRGNDDELEDDEPSAVIVDVEDVVEETAELLAAAPAVHSETPVYCYAPEEVTRLIDSSGSDSERDSTVMVRRTDSVRTESSYKLIEENMSLLSKLQVKGDICRKLETDLEHLEEKIDHVTKSYEEELERLRQEENDVQDSTNARVTAAVRTGERSEDQRAIVEALRARIQELERRQERLRREGATLQNSFVEQSEQQTALAQNIVGKMKQLQQANSNMASFEQDQQNVAGCLTGRQEDAVTLVQGLSSQLLTLAEKLEVALAERNREIHSLRHELEERRRDVDTTRLSRGLSADNSMSLSMGSLTGPEVNLNRLHSTGPYLPRQSSVELTQLPSLLTSKVLELKKGLNYLCATSEPVPNVSSPPEETTTFVLKLSPKKQTSKPSVQKRVPTSPIEDPPSPVTLVTITPAFMMRSPTIVKEINIECEKRELIDSRDRRVSETPSQEDGAESYGSAVSLSTSSTNGDRDRVQDSEEKIVETKERKCSENKSVVDNDEKKSKIKKNTKLCRKSGVLHDQKKLIESTSRRSSDTLVAYKRNKSDNAISPQIKVHTLVDEEQEAKSNPELAAPVNVFVPTTRKIFSPVRRDSKGKASSAISYVVEEESEPQEVVPSCTTPETNTRQNGIGMTPQWMIMRSRSQSSSPALPRRMLTDDSCAESSGSSYRGPRFSLDSGEGKLPKDGVSGSSGSISNVNIVKSLNTEIQKDSNTESKLNIVLRTNSQKELSVDKDKKDLIFNASRPTTPLGFPPLPPSPSPGRRDLFKQIAKDTAPSIRMMIAKYNQKLTEQDGGRSPEVGGSGSGSPVAWRSPVAERRVRNQMAKYQEEVQRVLQQGSRRIGRMGYGEVQKSASAGFIRSHDSSSSQSSSKNDSSDEKPVTPFVVRRGILKSSSAGSIKPVSSSPLPMQPCQEPKVVKSTIIPPESSIPVVVVKISSKDPLRNDSPTPEQIDSPTISRSPISPASPASSTMGSPPISRLRALRLQRAKEEFLTRGPGGRSWTSEEGTPITGTPSMSMSPEPHWIREVASCSGESSMNRLSQISVGSESSYDSQLLPFTPEEEEDGGLLIKSASAGMINVDSKTFKKFNFENKSDDATQTTIKEKQNSNTKFGISSITSKFRKVKMRKNKDKDGGSKSKLNTVSLLCRQSLLVDINKKESGEGPSTSKSCPSSPVLQRTMSTENTRSGDEAGNRSTGSWILNPTRKIFKPK